MNSNESFTTEEIAQLLKVSKLTVYDLIKKENCRHIESADRCESMLKI